MLEPGQILQERYQLQKRLGRTGAGRQTWLSLDLQTEEQVILKLLAFSPQMQWDELKLFEREAQILQALSHPRIPCYRDYFSIDSELGAGLPWFVLVQNYIPGLSLQEMLEAGHHFTEKQVRRVAIEVLQILTYLHELSPPVLHRDIKPSNVILGEDHRIYLVDFGAVQDKTAVTGMTFTIVGTSGYAPLEQFWGRAVPASDLYALGATLIHLATGVHPADLPQKAGHIQFADRISLNDTFIEWLKRLTKFSLDQRFSSARQALGSLKSKTLYRAIGERGVVKRIPQPDGSTIQLDKTDDRLEIVFPNPIQTYHLIILAFPFFSAFSMAISLAPMLIPFVVLFSYTALAFFLPAYKDVYILFRRDQFRIQWRLLGHFSSLDLQARTADIISVFLTKNASKYSVEIRTESLVDEAAPFGDGAPVNRTYQIQEKMTEREAIWLAQEIQDWLNYR